LQELLVLEDFFRNALKRNAKRDIIPSVNEQQFPSFQSQPPPPPQGPPRQSIWKKIFAPFAAILVFLGKFKILLIPLLKFAPFLKTGLSMLLCIGTYAWAYGWSFAIGLVALIFIHEYGHLHAARRCGLKVGLPVFIPFMGAVIALKEAPRSAKIEAEVGIGGPIWGTAGSIGALFLYYWLHWPILLVSAYVGFCMNLFNLIPIPPLDGGRVVAAVSPWLWIVGIVLMVGHLIYSFNFILLAIVIFILPQSFPRIVAFFRGQTLEDPSYYDLSPQQRIFMGLQYFALIGALTYLMESTNQQLNIIHPT
jgi:Zn-dependent protease